LNEFEIQNDLESIPKETALEHFTGYIVTSSHYSESFSSEDINVGLGINCGIDGSSIIVNDCLLNESEEIEDLVDTNV
jgi:hypothetical protein